jgi:iron complex transport system substrate-binding protein
MSPDAQRLLRPSPSVASAGVAISCTAALLAIALGSGCARASEEVANGAREQPRRIVAIGGAVTEIVYALGAGDRVVAVDTSSVFPEAVAKQPKVGYQRTLAAEGILALDPDLVVASAEAGPPTTLAQLREAGVRVELMAPAENVDAAADRIRAVGSAIGERAAATDLADRIERAASASVERAAAAPSQRRVLFLYARGGGTTMVSGNATAAAAMIALAGGQNAVTGWDGFRPLSAEAALAAAPDVILVPSRGLDALGGVDGVVALPGLAETPAGKARRVAAIDDLLLLGFGPRLPEGIDALAKALAE